MVKRRNREPSPKQIGYVNNLVKYYQGEIPTKKDCALLAGYSPGTVKNSMKDVVRTTGVQKLIKELINNADIIYDTREVIREGLHAEKLVYSKEAGMMNVPDYAERRRTAELVLKLGGSSQKVLTERSPTVNIAIMSEKIKDIINE